MTSPSTADLLTTVVDAVVPADDYPSASESGVLDFLQRLREHERPEWGRRINAVVASVDAASWRIAGNGFIGLDQQRQQEVLDGLADDAEFGWFAQLINLAYYGDNARSATPPRSWEMIDWRPGPPGGWPTKLPPVPFHTDGLIGPEQLQSRYDAVVIGSGAGGGAAAQVLAESGRTVLIIEAGDGPETSKLDHDHLRNPRINTGLTPWSGPLGAGHPRTLELGGDRVAVGQSDPRWGNNAFTVGGGTRVYGAQAWRFAPKDFRMASEYGVPDGSALADWPIGYDDLEPYYSEAEWRFGVSGLGSGDPWSGTRTRDYPMPPVSGIGNPAALAAGAQRLGWGTLPVPLLVNSSEHRGRSACLHCAQCVGFACPVEAKGGSHNTAIPAALATGRGFLITNATAERVITDNTGTVTGVALVGDDRSGQWRRQVTAGEVIIAAGATETARLLLLSAHDHEPNGIGNNTDQVGRHLQAHLYAGALGVFEDEIFTLEGPGVSIATCDFRHGNADLVGGGMLANEFVPTPSSTFDYLVSAGVFPPYGPRAKDGMRQWTRRMTRVVGPIQEVTSAESRVRLDPDVRDRYGNPVAALSGALHPSDLRARDFMTERAAEWLTAAGASQVFAAPPGGGGPNGPSTGQHQAGTCRMGTDPKSSVTDPDGRVWGHDNLWVADGSLNVTNGGVNPVLTIFAGALRVADRIAGGVLNG
ncbi:GMC family oxidoreductase [Microlunatus soli]|uniref:Choline dehydrogenase n=1 Tax=Microlunatus soli TaxID=630515 RepID=A0A1H1X8Y4_9ACTN|nr:GMC family oxidoreductase [Microlunatus soli]SDT05672.1 Choline dehydrogenase [Microlunatus soli]